EDPGPQGIKKVPVGIPEERSASKKAGSRPSAPDHGEEEGPRRDRKAKKGISTGLLIGFAAGSGLLVLGGGRLLIAGLAGGRGSRDTPPIAVNLAPVVQPVLQPMNNPSPGGQPPDKDPVANQPDNPPVKNSSGNPPDPPAVKDPPASQPDNPPIKSQPE